ncbi:MAG: hypothetical protein NTY51_06800 [Deltaproteobacteria bacterium]|nr:hypothetical protein [Deltaproteobacteria bacterium]
MDYNLLIKAGFMGFAASIGAISVIFWLMGFLFKIDKLKFNRIYMLACVVSFGTTYLLLHLKIRSSGIDSPEIFLVGVIGGWLSSVLFGITQFKNILRNFLRGPQV